MMNNDHLFDEMIRLKAQQRSFDTVDAGWEKMQELLPQKRTRPVVGLRIAVLACLFAALAGGGFVFLLFRTEVVADSSNENVRACTAVRALQRDATALNAPNSSGYTAQQHSNTSFTEYKRSNTNNSNNNNSATEKASVHNSVAAPDVHVNALQLEVPTNEAIALQSPAANTNGSYAQQKEASAEKQIETEIEKHTARSFDADVKLPSLALLSSSEKTAAVALPVQWSPDANYWLVQGGMSYTAPLTENAQASISPVVGVGYNVWLNPAWSLQAGVRYSFIGNVADIRTSDSVALSPGVFEYSGSHMQRLHSLSLPLQVWKRAGYRHAFSAGYTLNFLVGAQQQDYSYTETNGIISNENSSSSFTQSGFSRFDGLFTAGYSYTFTNRVQAEVSVYSGLTDIMHNGSYGNRFERNRGVQLLVNYSF